MRWICKLFKIRWNKTTYQLCVALLKKPSYFFQKRFLSCLLFHNYSLQPLLRFVYIIHIYWQRTWWIDVFSALIKDVLFLSETKYISIVMEKEKSLDSDIIWRLQTTFWACCWVGDTALTFSHPHHFPTEATKGC